jgi:hypothetical protein
LEGAGVVASTVPDSYGGAATSELGLEDGVACHKFGGIHCRRAPKAARSYFTPS